MNTCIYILLSPVLSLDIKCHLILHLSYTSCDVKVKLQNPQQMFWATVDT